MPRPLAWEFHWSSSLIRAPVTVKNTRCLATGLAAIQQLDLSQVKRKIMEPSPEGKGWDQETADRAELWYRRYLEVCLRHPEFPAVPNRHIDDFWHQHILDTRAYAADCQNIFGEFLHHYPYFGLNGDAAERDGAFDQTDAIYISLFGESCVAADQVAGQAVGAGCNHSGSGTGCGQGGRGGRAPAPDYPTVPATSLTVRTKCCTGCVCAADRGLTFREQHPMLTA